MSKGGGGTQTTNSTSTVSLPDWVTNQAKSNLSRAQGVADNLMPAYTGPRVAGMTNGQQSLIGQLMGVPGMSDGAYNAAGSTLANLQGFSPASVTAGQIGDTDLSRYMNPFTQNVIDTSMKTLEQQRLQALNGVGDTAMGAKAFGGSRQGVQEGVTNAQSAIGAGQLAAGLNLQNFQNAQQMAGQDIAGRMSADLANQNAGVAGAGLRLNAANSGAAVAGQQQQSRLQGLTSALTGQSMLQAQDQANIDAQRQQYAEQQQYPVQQLSILQSALANTPYGSTTTGQQTTQLPAGNGLMSGIGAGLGILGTVGSLFGGGGAFPLVGASSLLK